MNSIDPIILTAYLLCIAFFLNRIKEAFNDEFTIRVNEDALKQQLQEQGLQDAIGISFRFDKRYEFYKLKQLSISISNKSDNSSVYVDWDQSALTDLEKRSRRVTRLPPGTALDLFQHQAFSTITPNTTLKEIITAEDLLQRKGDRKDNKLQGDDPQKLEVEPAKPLIDLKPAKPSDDLKKRLKRFINRKIDLEFTLGLTLRFSSSNNGDSDRRYIVCTFVLKKLPWTSGLPFNPTK